MHRADDVWESRVPGERRVVVWVRKAASQSLLLTELHLFLGSY